MRNYTVPCVIMVLKNATKCVKIVDHRAILFCFAMIARKHTI